MTFETEFPSWHEGEMEAVADITAPLKELIMAKDLDKQRVREVIDIKDQKVSCAYGNCFGDCSHIAVARVALRELKKELGL